jgi:3-hydroxyisobutyrate dehydrogenase
MGTPMALNLLRAGHPLVVWNRTPAKAEPLAAAGAAIAEDPERVLRSCHTTILMLADDHAIDAVLGRAGGRFAESLAGRTIVHMGTTLPAYSRKLEADILAAGGRYLEAPVSGSRAPAERGELIGMLAGAADVVADNRILLAPMCRHTICCGAVPNALLMKLAVNTFLIGQVTALAESASFAVGQGLEVDQLLEIVDAGPMASEVSRGKSAKLRAGAFNSQASVANVAEVCRLITAAGSTAGLATPLLSVCGELFREAVALGFADADMIGVVNPILRRSGTVSDWEEALSG